MVIAFAPVTLLTVETPDTPDKPTRPPNRVLAVVFPLVFVAFVLGVRLTATLIHTLAPYVYFSLHAVRAEHITTTDDRRGLLAFSNGQTIHGLKLLPIGVMWIVLSSILILGSFFALLRLAAHIIRRRDPDWADDVQHFLKYAEEAE
jgi:hypothetical protein